MFSHKKEPSPFVRTVLNCARKDKGMPVRTSLLRLEFQRAETHAAGRCNRREESRESGYYNLHRNLDEALFHLYTSFPD